MEKLPRLRFKKENRVLKRADFLQAYSQGKCYRRKSVQVFIQQMEPPTLPTRLGLTATRKTGNAVVRNRLKRLGRESFRLALPELKSGFTIIVNFSRGAVDAKFEGIDRQLRSVWREAGLLQDRIEDNDNRTADGAAG